MGPNAIASLIIFLSGFSMIIVVGAIAYYRWHFRQREQVIETKAVVVDNIYRSQMYHPVIEFTTENGEKLQFTSKIGSSPPRAKTGSSTTVYYLRHKPSKYIIESGLFLRIFGTITFVLGLIICLMGVFIYFGVGN